MKNPKGKLRRITVYKRGYANQKYPVIMAQDVSCSEQPQGKNIWGKGWFGREYLFRFK